MSADHLDRLLTAARGGSLRPRPRYRYAPAGPAPTGLAAGTSPGDAGAPSGARAPAPDRLSQAALEAGPAQTGPTGLDARAALPGRHAGQPTAKGHPSAGDPDRGVRSETAAVVRGSPDAAALRGGPGAGGRPARDHPAAPGGSPAPPERQAAPGGSPATPERPAAPGRAAAHPTAPGPAPRREPASPARRAPYTPDALRASESRPPAVAGTTAADSLAADTRDPGQPERPPAFDSAPAAGAAPDARGAPADPAGPWPDALTSVARDAATTDAPRHPSASQPERPVVRVTIGRIDVHATPAEPTRTRRARAEPAVSLDDYLRQQR